MDVRNTKDLVKAESYNWKVLICGPAGSGKTTWVSGAPELGIAACEPGEGSGTLSIAYAGVDFVEPRTLPDFRSICYDTFAPFQKKRSVALDSLTYMTRSFLKDHSLTSFPARNRSEAMRRAAGVPVGYDFGDIAELTRGLLNQLLAQKKHVIVTALQKIEKDETGSIVSIGPDLPGALRDAAPGMFDSTLYLKVRKRYLDPKDPKSVFYERYFVTGNDGVHNCRDRNGLIGKGFLDMEEVFNPNTSQGTFTALLNKILAGHANAQQVK